MNDKYILEGRTPVKVNLETWARWFETADRKVRRTTKGDVEVSTVFLGLDHAFGNSEKPLLFETMVFGGPLDQETDRTSTWEEAEAAHEKMVERIVTHE